MIMSQFNGISKNHMVVHNGIRSKCIDLKDLNHVPSMTYLGYFVIDAQCQSILTCNQVCHTVTFQLCFNWDQDLKIHFKRVYKMIFIDSTCENNADISKNFKLPKIKEIEMYEMKSEFILNFIEQAKFTPSFTRLQIQENVRAQQNLSIIVIQNVVDLIEKINLSHEFKIILVFRTCVLFDECFFHFKVNHSTNFISITPFVKLYFVR